MSLSDIATLAGAIQAFAVAIAVACGGVWAWYQFVTLRATSKARAELAKLQTEVQSLRRGLIERGTMNLTMTTLPLPPGRMVMATVTVHNAGNCAEVINWASASCVAVPVQHMPNGLTVDRATALGGVGFSDAVQLHTSSMAPGERQTFPYVFSFPSDGLYLILFSVACSASEQTRLQADHAAVGISPRGEATWNASTFVRIAETAT